MTGVISTALKHLIAAGVSGDDLVRAVSEMEAAMPQQADKAAERRREKDRAYQAARRHNRQISADSPDTADAAPPNEYISNPPVPPVEAKASTAPRGRSDRGSKIPIDWEPPAIAELSPEAQALAEKWPVAAYRAEAEAFRNYWTGESSSKARKSNWNTAWANRIVAVNGKVLREAKFAGATNTVGRAPARPMNASEIRNAIRFAEDHDDPDRAAELKQQLERITVQRPSGPIGDLVSRTVAGMRS